MLMSCTVWLFLLTAQRFDYEPKPSPWTAEADNSRARPVSRGAETDTMKIIVLVQGKDNQKEGKVLLGNWVHKVSNF
jgi:hypothetical protein